MKTVNRKSKQPALAGERFKVAVVHAAPVVFDRERTLKKVQATAAEAARQGARLVVFPDAFVSAYPQGLDFGDVVRHYARPDIFQLQVDERAKKPVTTQGTD
jgi:predicted amidohydrolase